MIDLPKFTSDNILTHGMGVTVVTYKGKCDTCKNKSAIE